MTIDELQRQVDKLRQERDVLEAHVERQGAVIFQALAAIEDDDLDAVPYDEARAVHNESPAASLARQMLLERAEELEMLYRESSGHAVIARGTLLDRARERRRQAEEYADD